MEVLKVREWIGVGLGAVNIIVLKNYKCDKLRKIINVN